VLQELAKVSKHCYKNKMFNAKANVESQRLMPMQLSTTSAGDDVESEQPQVISSPTLVTGV
jgi:hypothetical protein